MTSGCSRPNSPFTFFSAASIAALFSGLEKSVKGSLRNSESMNRILSAVVSRLTWPGDIGVLVAPGGPDKIGYVIQIVDQGKRACSNARDRLQRNDAVVAQP